MEIINLKNGWILGSKPQSSLPPNIIKPALDLGNWMKVTIPEDVNATLLRYKKIPNPHYDTQARKCYWVTEQEWWYKLQFDVSIVSSTKIDLCMDRVDGHADIWLNDSYLGETKNAFRLFRFDVTGLLKTRGNILLLRFRSIDQLLGGPRLDELAGWKSRRAFLRKPQFSFGWDWALPLPSIGLAGSVWLEIDSQYRLVDAFIQTFSSGRVDFGFEVTTATSGNIKGGTNSARDNVFSAVGSAAIHTFTFVNDTDQDFAIIRAGTCDITIDDVDYIIIKEESILAILGGK